MCKSRLIPLLMMFYCSLVILSSLTKIVDEILKIRWFLSFRIIKLRNDLAKYSLILIEIKKTTLRLHHQEHRKLFQINTLKIYNLKKKSSPECFSGGNRNGFM